jgi:hypothetical protein
VNKAKLSQFVRRRRFNLLFAVGAVLLCARASWLIVSDTSPYRGYFLWHVDIPNRFYALHTIPLLVGFLVSGNVHQPSPVGFWCAAAVMWFVIGYVVSFVFSVPFHALCRAFHRNERSA